MRIDEVEKILYEYPLLKIAVENGIYPPITSRISDDPRGSGVSNNTEKYALIILEKKDKIDKIELALSQLDEVELSVIKTTYFEEPIYVVDIAQKLNITVRTYYNKRSDALVKLAKMLNVI